MDSSLFFLIFGIKNPFLNFLMIFGAEYLIYVAIFLIFLFFLKGTLVGKKSFIVFLFSLPILILIIKIIHLFILRDRPFITESITPLIIASTDASFPSRHAAIMSALAFSYLIFQSQWYLLFLFLAIWVGFARVYVGVHYPFDILGGFIVGFISVVSSKQIINFLKLKLL